MRVNILRHLEHSFGLPEALPRLLRMSQNYALLSPAVQLLAEHAAQMNGRDADMPRRLVKAAAPPNQPRSDETAC